MSNTITQEHPLFWTGYSMRFRGRHFDSVFRTELDGRELWDKFFAAIPDDLKQIYKCRCCRDVFINAANLLALKIDGNNLERTSVLFDLSEDDVALLPDWFSGVFAELKELVLNSRVKSPYLRSFSNFVHEIGVLNKGFPKDGNGEYQHFHISIAGKKLGKQDIAGNSYEGLMARYNDIIRGGRCGTGPKGMLSYLEILKAAAENYDLPTSIKKQVNTFYEAVRRGVEIEDGAGNPVIYQQFKSAHALTLSYDLEHLSSTVLGTALTELESGIAAKEVAERMAERSSPTNYKRVKEAALTAKALEVESKWLQENDYMASLERRLATRDDIEIIPIGIPTDEDEVLTSSEKALAALTKQKGIAAKKEGEEIIIPGSKKILVKDFIDTIQGADVVSVLVTQLPAFSEWSTAVYPESKALYNNDVRLCPFMRITQDYSGKQGPSATAQDFFDPATQAFREKIPVIGMFDATGLVDRDSKYTYALVFPAVKSTAHMGNLRIFETRLKPELRHVRRVIVAISEKLDPKDYPTDMPLVTVNINGSEGLQTTLVLVAEVKTADNKVVTYHVYGE